MLFTTPHLSRIHHAEAALLALLEEEDRPVPDGAEGRTPPQAEMITIIWPSEESRPRETGTFEETEESRARRSRAFKEEGEG